MTQVHLAAWQQRGFGGAGFEDARRRRTRRQTRRRWWTNAAVVAAAPLMLASYQVGTRSITMEQALMLMEQELVAEQRVGAGEVHRQVTDRIVPALLARTEAVGAAGTPTTAAVDAYNYLAYTAHRCLGVMIEQSEQFPDYYRRHRMLIDASMALHAGPLSDGGVELYYSSFDPTWKLQLTVADAYGNDLPIPAWTATIISEGDRRWTLSGPAGHPAHLPGLQGDGRIEVQFDPDTVTEFKLVHFEVERSNRRGETETLRGHSRIP
ncbi:MAG: hypothetical protein AAF628_19830 [Planctomycetota bacterium]